MKPAPSLLRRHTRTVSPPPLPAFVFLPPKHFWPLAERPRGSGLAIKGNTRGGLFSGDGSAPWSSGKRTAHGKAGSRANATALPGSASSRNAARTWTSRAALALRGLPRSRWAQLCCRASYKAEESIRLRAKSKPRSSAAPASPRFGLIPRAAPTLTHHPPPTHPPPHSQVGQELGTVRSIGDLRAHSVPAGEIKHSPLHAFSLILFQAVPLHTPLQAASSTRHPLLSSPPIAPPTAPGAPPLLQPFLGNSPLSPADTHGSQTCGPSRLGSQGHRRHWLPGTGHSPIPTFLWGPLLPSTKGDRAY